MNRHLVCATSQMKLLKQLNLSLQTLLAMSLYALEARNKKWSQRPASTAVIVWD